MINGNDTFTGGTAANVYPLVRGMYNKRKDKINAFGWNNEFNVGAATIVADVSYSKANRDELSLENNTSWRRCRSWTRSTWTTSATASRSSTRAWTIRNPDQRCSCANTIYGSGYGKMPKVEDELKSFKLAATIACPSVDDWFADIDFGVNYADREKKKRQPEGNINCSARRAIPSSPPTLQYGLVDLGFAGVGIIPSWNVPGAVAAT